MTPRFLTETWRGETRILFSIRAFYKCRRADKSIPNRTLRPAGRPCGRERGFARCGGLCAWRVIGRWLYRPFSAGFGRPGQVAAVSDQRERFVQFRAGARTGIGAVAVAAANPSFRTREDSHAPLATYSISSIPERLAVLPHRTYRNGSFLFGDRAHGLRRCRRLPAGPASADS